MFAAATSLAPASAVPCRSSGARAGARPARVAARTAVAPAPRRRLAVRLQAAAASATAGPDPELVELKMALLDSFWGTDRGLAASSDSRAEINELITQLEARNPTPEPNEARAALGGTWRLAYTSNSELIALLALGRLPLVTVGEVTQSVDPLGMTVENRVELEAPLSKTALSATASFEVRSPKLLQVKFEEGRVSTPQLLSDLALPSSLELLGQQIDLTPVQSALQPVEGPLRSALGTLGGLLSGLPDLRIPLSSTPTASSWLLNTYLDDSLRITRGDGGSVFVLVRDGSSDGSDAWASGAAAMNTGDWEAMEDQDPLPSSSAGASVAAAKVAAASEASGETVVVVEPSAVIEEGQEGGHGSNGNGTAAL
ncbi:hypothetical protein ABPG75_013484 [Micractinium tetrahymenae]